MSHLSPNRLLPTTAIVVFITLAIKVSSLAASVPSLGRVETDAAVAARAAGEGASRAVLAQAQAAQVPPVVAAPPSPSAPGAAAMIPSSPGAAPQLPSAKAPEGQQRAPGEQAGANAAAIASGAPEATGLPGERSKDGRSPLEMRQQELAARETTLAAAEKRLSLRVVELAALQTRLQSLEKGLKERDEANWSSMVKLYESMRPRDAAAIFNSLDKTVLIEIVDRMKPAKAAPIIAAMDAEMARQVTADLAAKRTRTTTLTN